MNSSYDDKKGQGYGQLKNRKLSSNQFGSAYPYTNTDDEEYLNYFIDNSSYDESEIKTQNNIRKKTKDSDQTQRIGINKRRNNTYIAGGNTQIGESIKNYREKTLPVFLSYEQFNEQLKLFKNYVDEVKEIINLIEKLFNLLNDAKNKKTISKICNLIINKSNFIGNSFGEFKNEQLSNLLFHESDFIERHYDEITINIFNLIDEIKALLFSDDDFDPEIIKKIEYEIKILINNLEFNTDTSNIAPQIINYQGFTVENQIVISDSLFRELLTDIVDPIFHKFKQTKLEKLLKLSLKKIVFSKFIYSDIIYGEYKKESKEIHIYITSTNILNHNEVFIQHSNEFLKTIIHEIGHHVHEVLLNKEAKNYWDLQWKNTLKGMKQNKFLSEIHEYFSKHYTFFKQSIEKEFKTGENYFDSNFKRSFYVEPKERKFLLYKLFYIIKTLYENENEKITPEKFMNIAQKAIPEKLFLHKLFYLLAYPNEETEFNKGFIKIGLLNGKLTVKEINNSFYNFIDKFLSKDINIKTKALYNFQEEIGYNSSKNWPKMYIPSNENSDINIGQIIMADTFLSDTCFNLIETAIKEKSEKMGAKTGKFNDIIDITNSINKIRKKIEKNFKNLNPVSEYAKINNMEDFAETFMYYILDKSKLTKEAEFRFKRTLSLSNLYGDKILQLENKIRKIINEYEKLNINQTKNMHDLKGHIKGSFRGFSAPAGDLNLDSHEFDENQIFFSIIDFIKKENNKENNKIY